MTALLSPGPRRAMRLLGLLCLGLGAVIALELSGDRGAPPAPAGGAPGKARRPGADAGFAMPPASTFAEIVARPLFSDTRRPSADIGAQAEARPDFVLVGTILSRETRDALVRHGRPARVDHVAQGQSLDGWTVHSILSDRVIFTRADARLEVKAKDGPVLAVQPRGGAVRETARVDASPAPAGSNLTSVPSSRMKE